MLFAYHFNCFFAGSGERTERRLKRKKRVNNVIPLFRRPFRRNVHTYIYVTNENCFIIFFLFVFSIVDLTEEELQVKNVINEEKVNQLQLQLNIQLISFL